MRAPRPLIRYHILAVWRCGGSRGGVESAADRLTGSPGRRCTSVAAPLTDDGSGGARPLLRAWDTAGVDVRLRPMDVDAVARFLERSRAGFVGELVAAGSTEEAAEATARRQQTAAFPGGRPAPEHLLFDIAVDTQVAGHLWIGPSPEGGAQDWWIWDLEVDESHRSHGVGRAVMGLAEDEARARGADSLGLSVFAGNEVARRLYRSVGYREVAVRMRKDLG